VTKSSPKSVFHQSAFTYQVNDFSSLVSIFHDGVSESTVYLSSIDSNSSVVFTTLDSLSLFPQATNANAENNVIPIATLLLILFLIVSLLVIFNLNIRLFFYCSHHHTCYKVFLNERVYHYNWSCCYYYSG